MKIKTVEPGSVAEKAGFKVDDVFTRSMMAGG